MRPVAALIVLVLTGETLVQWYGGDPDNSGGLAAEYHTLWDDAFVFENFDHAGGVMTDLWGNYYMNYQAVGYVYEIRSGVSNGFGGTLQPPGAATVRSRSSRTAGTTSGSWASP